MALVGLVLAWLIMVLVGSVVYGGGRPAPLVTLAGLLLGRWPGFSNRPTAGELLLVIVGRIGSLLLLLTLLRVVLVGNWLETCSAAALLVMGLVGLAYLGRERAILPGLAGVQVLLRLPDEYQVLLGQVVPGGPLCGVSLAALDLRRHGLLVLAVGKGGRNYVHFPKGQEILGAGDLLVVYGRPEHWRTPSET
ncbi:MAG: TrkA C-terminal domain-containing protein [Patescibacteria group bacterium]